MKKHSVCTLIGILILFSVWSNLEGKDAARLRIVKTILITPKGGGYHDPKLSPDGKLVAFRGGSTGLFVRNADGTGPLINVLPRGKGTQDYAWSPDSKLIVYKLKTGRETKRMNTTFHIFDLETKQSRILKPDVPRYGRIRWTDRGIELKSPVPIRNRETRSVESFNKVLDASTGELRQSNEPIVYFEQADNHNYIIVDDGRGNTILRKKDYYLPLMSPKKDMLLAGHSPDGHTHVLNLEGKIIADLGLADSEQWSFNGKLIIYQIPKEDGWDGQEIVASEIYVINADGSGKNQLTHTPDIIEMDPQWSGDALKITYFDGKTGRIYVSELEELQ